MPKLTIDGKEIEVPKGTRIIEAARKLGIEIPFYCYHPGLSIAGNCRMCLVEIEKMPKLQLSCHLEAADGMVVRTNTEKVKATRQHVLEFLLLNHPVDCPVCDQAGECWLQDYYLNYGAYTSRLNENKNKKPKAVSLGPTVMLDAERCILCSRCVRFSDEISKTSELGIIHRGAHGEISLFPEKELNNPYSGNVVDICPVGALTDKDFRFKVRVWYLESKPSLCNGCARGCAIDVQYRTKRLHHARGQRVMRLKPRFHEAVNRWWMCDEGRYGYKTHDHNRILKPLVRTSTQPEEVSWEEIYSEVAGRIKSAKNRLAILLSPGLSNEELFLAGQLFRKKLGLKNIFLVSPSAPGYQDEILIRADKNPNTKGAELLGYTGGDEVFRKLLTLTEKGELEGMILFGQDLPKRWHEAISEVLSKLSWTLFSGSNHSLMSELATYVMPAATHFEKDGSFTNFEGKVQPFNAVFEPLGDSRPEWKILLELAKTLGVELPYQDCQAVFSALSREVPAFQTLTMAAPSDIRRFAEPMIPEMTQESSLIFFQQNSEGSGGLK